MIRILLLVLVLGASGDHFLFDGHFMDAAQQVVGQIALDSAAQPGWRPHGG